MRWAAVGQRPQNTPARPTASVCPSTALDTWSFLLALQRTANSHVSANSAVGLSFAGLGRRMPGSDQGFLLSEAAGGRHRSNVGAQREPSLAGALLRREVCLPRSGLSGPDADPGGRRRLLTCGVWVTPEWWGSIPEAFLMLLFFLLLLLQEL